MEKPAIYINGRFLSQPLTGVQRFAIEMVRALDALLERDQGAAARGSVELLCPANARDFDGLSVITARKFGRLSGHAWEQLELPRVANAGLLVNLCNTGPLLQRNHLTTIHDCGVYSHPEAYSFAFRLLYRLLHWRLVRSARVLATVTQFAARELVRYCGADLDKIILLPNSAEQMAGIDADNNALAKWGLRRHEYIFSLGSRNKLKNIENLVAAFALLKRDGLKLALAGRNDPRIFQTIDTGSMDGVVELGPVSDGELKALLQNALFMAFPSRYEGFGIPPLEAMTCGCPVVASDRASIPEVCGEAALYCDAEDIADIAEKMAHMADSPDERERFAQLGLARAAEFSWHRTAQTLWQTI